jgi:secreted PhoX family phosphatase
MKASIMLFLSVLTMAGVSCKKSTSTVTSPKEKRWVVTTFAGNGNAVFNDGPNLSASFRAPLDVIIDSDGAIYVADANNHRIRKIAQGQVSTFAGVGFEDTTSGDHTIAGFAHPSYLALDATNNVFTLDVNDPRVRKISPFGYVSVVAGNGTDGFADGHVNVAEFGSECAGIAVDEEGNIYVLDWRNRRVRKVTVEGEVKTFAGNGKIGFINGAPDVAELYNPSGLVIDRQGNLFLGDQSCIRKITPDGIVGLFSGSQSVTGYKDGQPGEALFSAINDIAIDEQGNIYVTDDHRVRKMTPQGVVSTIAGSTAGYIDGEANAARFNDPVGLAVDRQGNIYVADDHNNRIRKISFE